jgi:hypothetical protein
MEYRLEIWRDNCWEEVEIIQPKVTIYLTHRGQNLSIAKEKRGHEQ